MKYTWLVEYTNTSNNNIEFTSERKLRKWLKDNRFKPNDSVPGRYVWQETFTHRFLHAGPIIDVTKVPVLSKRYEPKPYIFKE